ncbi:MAG: hypothetical protein IKH08_07940 [Prevotella sp.]|nr:hypothetical protein [Prevotella sp.]MBR4600965.1 hypothetical protein [Prevotella sp.]
MGNKESFFCVTATPFIYVSEMKKEAKNLFVEKKFVTLHLVDNIPKVGD